MRLFNYTWIAVFKDGSVIEKFPKTGEDNSGKWREVQEKQNELEALFYLHNNERIGVHFNRLEDNFLSYFSVGEQALLPIHIDQDSFKIVQFITRTVVANIGNDVTGAVENPKLFCLGIEDKNGKLFLCLEEDSGYYFLTNTTP